MAISGIPSSAPRAAPTTSQSVSGGQGASRRSADVQKLLNDLSSLTGAGKANRAGGVDANSPAGKIEKADKTTKAKTDQTKDQEKLDKLLQKIEKLMAQMEKLKGSTNATQPGNGNPGIVPPNPAQQATGTSSATQGPSAV